MNHILLHFLINLLYKFNMNVLPAGFSDDENDYDGFDYFAVPDNKSYNSSKNNGDDMAETSKSTPTEIPYMEQLKAAILNDLTESVEELLKSNPDIQINSQIPSLAWPPILLAASRGNIDIIHILLKFGADANIHQDFYTAVMALCSCELGSSDNLKECLIALHEAGAHLDTSDRHGMTALMYACVHSQEVLVEYLLPLSHIDATDTQGWTAIFYAVSKNETNIIKMLRAHGAASEICDVRGNSPRQLAIDKGFMEIVQLLTNSEDEEVLAYEEIEKSNLFPIWQDMFPGLTQSDTPEYFDEVKQFLHGVDLGRYIKNMQVHNIGFPTLLALTDGELETIGILLPYHRRRILHSVHVFHSHRWNRRTLNVLPKDESFSVNNILPTIGIANKHFLIITSSLKYLNNRLIATKNQLVAVNTDDQSNNPQKKQECLKEIQQIKDRIAALKTTIARLKYLTKQVEKNAIPPADLLTSQAIHSTGFTFSKLIYVGLLTVSILVAARKFKTTRQYLSGAHLQCYVSLLKEKFL